MKSQSIPSAHGQGDWDRGRNEADPHTGASGSEQDRPYPRSAPENYPESHQQYQAQREHPGVGYFSGSPGYGGRGDYPQQQGQGGYGAQQQGYGVWSRPEAEGGYGGYRQQEAFQPAGGRQPGSGDESFSRAGYGRETPGRQPGGQYGSGQSGQGPQRESQRYGRTGPEGRPFEGSGNQPQGAGRDEPERWGHGQSGRQGGYQGSQQQGYGGYQTGQPEDFGAQEGGVFYPERGYPSGGQHSGGYGSYGAYEVGRQQVPSRTPRAPKDYVRSDERIRELICEQLAHHPGVDASEVSVQVSGGRVVLEGTVPLRRMKHVIEDVADGCWGVKDVENRIRVQSGLQSNLDNPAQGWLAAPADIVTGGASTRAATGRTPETDMSPVETGSGVPSAASARKPAGTQSKGKGRE